MERPKDATDDIIQRALKEEEEEKKLKKQAKQAEAKDKKVAKKGKTLEQIEKEEGGPIKESMVGMAHNKRVAKRKGAAVGDTDLVDDVEAVEEELEAQDEDGVPLEAFNLKEERRRGYFDEAGNYVEREGKDEDDVEDAWLKSDEAKVVSEETRRKIEEQQARMAAAEAAAPLTATQIARLQFQASQVLLPGETVAKALKRLGGHSRTARPQKRSKAGAATGAGQQAAAGAKGEGGGPEMDPAVAKEQFDRLTEAASNLMDAGETDVYTQTKEYFERCAAVYIDLPGPSNLFDAGPSKAAYEDADEDMFAADSDDEGAAAKKAKTEEGQQQPQQAAAAAADGPPAAQQAQQGAAPPAGGPPAAAAGAGAAAAAGDGTDYSSWPVKELRRFLTERGQNAEGIIDKEDLVAKVREVAAADAAAAAVAPPGYAFDPATGYWYSADAGLYWDASSGGFCNSGSGKWYSWDAAKQEFVEWQQ